MTVDQTMIPPEVLEAAAKAAYEKWAEQLHEREADTVGTDLLDDLCLAWDEIEAETKAEWLDQARAAIAAGLAAWPGAWEWPDTADGRAVVLPLPTEARDGI
jgi:NAD dependent epimerase/dehydratase family enzyme